MQTRLTKFPLIAKPTSAVASAGGMAGPIGSPLASASPAALAPAMPAAAAPVPAGPSDPAIERRVAEWAIQSGSSSSVDVTTNGGPKIHCRKLENVPAGDFEITSIHLLNTRQPFGDEFGQLPNLPKLQHLHILTPTGPLTDDQVRVIGKLRGLTDFHFNAKLNSIEVLYGELSKLTNLQTFSCMRGGLTDDLLPALANCGQLRSLMLSSNKLTDNAMPEIARMPGLNMLSLGSNPITDAGVAQLQTLRNLGMLHLDGTQITDEGVVVLARLPNLTTLGLSNTRITGAGVTRLSGIPNLRSLYLAQTAISDQDIVSLRSLPQLSYVDLGSTNVTDAGLKLLKEMPQLRTLVLFGTKVTREGVEAFTAVNPNCRPQVRYEQ